jgi:hypothetical protein
MADQLVVVKVSKSVDRKAMSLVLRWVDTMVWRMAYCLVDCLEYLSDIPKGDWKVDLKDTLKVKRKVALKVDYLGNH